ncbi:hypothetical protein CTAYLR_002128 [Chrysophaeum taylorii]|uniref:AMP-dependent synthetase/ligase domain-containing protein n=1 Tax=Chrysophaeum taylorii TaxID=2483200 RepID=A0AAD7XTT8_9STRA|nr:hypothetical protein CTAYLR_002128 [Chrysophaeum taylorii]
MPQWWRPWSDEPSWQAQASATATVLADETFLTWLDGSGAEAVDLSYGQVWSRSAGMAEWFFGVGLAAGDRAMLVYAPGPEFFVAFVACLRAGVLAVPNYPPDPSNLRRGLEKLDLVTMSCGARVGLTDDVVHKLRVTTSVLHSWPDIRWHNTDGLGGDHRRASRRLTSTRTRTPVVSGHSFASSEDASRHMSEEAMSENVSSASQNSLASRVFGSIFSSAGSDVADPDISLSDGHDDDIADPKGVMISHGNIWHNLNEIFLPAQRRELDVRLGEAKSNRLHDLQDLSEGIVTVSWLPQFHDLGLVAMLLGPWCAGYHVVSFSPLSFLADPLMWLRAMSKYHAQWTAAPDFAYQLCTKRAAHADVSDIDLGSVVYLVGGAGQRCVPSILREFAAFFAIHCNLPDDGGRGIFVPNYGLAEHVAPTCGEANGIVTSRRRPDLASCGSDFQIDFRIVDSETRCVVPDGAPGELWLSSGSVAKGYWGKPELTRETFHARLEPDDGKVYLRTGDEAFLEDGHLFICGRIKDMIIIGGENYYSDDVEIAATEAMVDAVRPGCIAAFSATADDDEEFLCIVLEVRDHAASECEALASTLTKCVRKAVGTSLKDHPDVAIILRQQLDVPDELMRRLEYDESVVDVADFVEAVKSNLIKMPVLLQVAQELEVQEPGGLPVSDERAAADLRTAVLYCFALHTLAISMLRASALMPQTFFAWTRLLTLNVHAASLACHPELRQMSATTYDWRETMNASGAMSEHLAFQFRVFACQLSSAISAKIKSRRPQSQAGSDAQIATLFAKTRQEILERYQTSQSSTLNNLSGVLGEEWLNKIRSRVTKREDQQQQQQQHELSDEKSGITAKEDLVVVQRSNAGDDDESAAPLVSGGLLETKVREEQLAYVQTTLLRILASMASESDIDVQTTSVAQFGLSSQDALMVQTRLQQDLSVEVHFNLLMDPNLKIAELANEILCIAREESELPLAQLVPLPDDGIDLGSSRTMLPQRVVDVAQVLLTVVVVVLVSIALIPSYHFGRWAQWRAKSIGSKRIRVRRDNAPWSHIKVAGTDRVYTYGLLVPLVIPLFMMSLTVITIASKWLVIGRYRVGTTRRGTRFFLRWWFVDRVLDQFNAWVGVFINDTLFINVFYLLMGAHISIHASVENHLLREVDLVSIGPYARASGICYARMFEPSGGMRFARVIIEPHSKIESTAIVMPGCKIEHGAVLEHGAATIAGQLLASENAYRSSPAQLVGVAQKNKPALPTGWLAFELLKLATLACYLFGSLKASNVLLEYVLRRLDWYSWRFRYRELLYFVMGYFLALFVSAGVGVVVFKWLLIGRLRPGMRKSTDLTWRLRTWFVEWIWYRVLLSFGAMLWQENGLISVALMKALVRLLYRKANYFKSDYYNNGFRVSATGRVQPWRPPVARTYALPLVGPIALVAYASMTVVFRAWQRLILCDWKDARNFTPFQNFAYMDYQETSTVATTTT